MKKITTILITSSLTVLMSTGFAASATDLSKSWNCTTNASSANTDSDKIADDKLANTNTSAASAFSLASQNCRDCTKITCEVKD
jgi:hypothetical protein